MYRPNNIQIHTTTNCVLNCKFCLKNKVTVPEIDLCMTVFKDYVDRCVDFGIRNFELSPCVGDPFGDPRIIERVEYLNSQDIDSVYFYTNLVMCTDDQLYRLSKFDKFKMYVSVYGDTRESFLENTNVDMFDRFTGNLSLLLNYPDMIDEFHMRYKGWNVNRILSIGNRLYSLLYTAFLERKIRLYQLIPKPDHCDWAGNMKASSDLNGPHVHNGRKGICHYAMIDNGIFPNGDITLCHWFDMEGKMIVGHVYDLESTYCHGSLYQLILLEQSLGVYRSMCINCQGYRRVCDDDPVI